MGLTLTKISETSSTITLGWTPPAGIGGYVFYANGIAVSTGSPNLKGGAPRREIKFSKTSPGPPFQVAAVCRQGGILLLDVGTYAEPSTGEGAPLDRFSAFRNNQFGPDSAYPGSGAIFNRKCDPAPSGNGFLNQGVTCPNPWSDGWSGIFEVDGGFDFRFGQTVPRSSGKGIQIADIDHLIPKRLPADFGFSWDFMFPAAGNPNGFPPWSGDPGTDEWNVLWEFTDAGFQSNAIGIANFVAPKPRLYVTAGNGVDNQKRRAKSSWIVQMDTWYSLRYEGRLSKGSDGRVILDAGPRGGAQERIADWAGPTSNPADGSPYIEFGWYGMNTPGRTEVRYRNMRNLLG